MSVAAVRDEFVGDDFKPRRSLNGKEAETCEG